MLQIINAENDLVKCPRQKVSVTSPNLQKDYGLGVMVVTSNSNSQRTKPYLQLDIPEFIRRYPEIDESSLEKVTQAIDCLMEIFHIFGLKRVTQQSEFSEQIKYYEQRSLAIRRCLAFMEKQGNNAWIPYMKYKTCAFYAHYESQELPPKPQDLDLNDKPNVIFGGYILSFQKKLLLDKELWNSFIVTILQAKMGMPRADPLMIKEAEEKTAIKLTTAPASMSRLCLACGMPTESRYHLVECDESTDRFLTKDVRLSVESLKSQLRRTTREMFQGVHYTREIHYEPFFPSTSANYIRSRGRCGAVGVVMDLIKNLNLTEDDLSNLVEMEESPAFVRGEQTDRFGNLGKVEQQFFDELRSDEEYYKGSCIQYNDTKLRKLWVRVMDRLKVMASFEEPLVEPVGLAEALKIRVISKGPPHIYTFLKPLQKLMWSNLKNNLVFKMIGTPFQAHHIAERIGKVTDEDIIINGDYKASTDNLHSWVSQTIVNEMIACFRECYDPETDFVFDDEFAKIFMTSLTNHKFEIDGKWVEQAEGQLMGSVTSFPILCLANAAMCRWALELSNGKNYHLKDTDLRNKSTIAPLLINGDDCTLKGKRDRLREIWEKITTFGGLETSIGKTLFSVVGKPIVVLNSKTFHYDVEWGTWEEKKFVNMGILLGKVRSAAGSANVRGYGQMGTLHRKLKEQSPDGVWDEVSSRFIHYNRSVLEQCPNIPWSAPEYLGGPGLVSKGLTKFDLRQISIIILKSKDKKFQIVKETIDKDWEMHELVQEEFKKFNVSEHFLEGCIDYELADIDYRMNPTDYGFDNDFKENQYSRLYTALTVQLLFKKCLADLHNQQVTDVEEYIKKKNLEKRNLKARQNNMRVWTRALNSMNLIHDLEVRTEEEISYEKKVIQPMCLKNQYLGNEYKSIRQEGIEGLEHLRMLSQSY